VPVAIVNKTMANRRWPGQSAVGQRIRLPGPSDSQQPITIVGVAADARQSDWTSPPSEEVYVALAQRSTEFGLAAMTFLLRTSVDPGSIAASVPAIVAEVDRGVPVSNITTMEDVVADALWRQRLTAQLTGAFALLALVLAAIGIYAAVGYAVGRRTREFGVRIALGGTPRQLEGLALVEGLRPVAGGAAIGTAIAFAASGFAGRLLFGVRATDPLAFAASAVMLLIVAACAAWIPARRASRQDPMVALRDS
jgi:ABC-type antimicrobial peptide transport system permease subunit